jgi:transposase
VVACLLLEAQGKLQKELRTFGTTTPELRELAQWLAAHGCQQVAIESTGVYWKPVFNMLERQGIQVLLANAKHMRNVPGRKTDMKDAEWIAQLLRHGLLKASFIPTAEIRELRELTRYRKKLIQLRADQCNRIQKLLETCNIKLASVASDILGASGREMLNALAEGETDAKKLAQMARGRLKQKIPQLAPALEGMLSASQRWLLREQLDEIEHLDEAIARLDQKVEEVALPFDKQIQRLRKIPGVNLRNAQVILAEIGADMSCFKTSADLASWAGICPGAHQSGGKRLSGKSRKGNTWLNAALTEAGWAASRAKDTDLQALYRRLARRRGRNRACRAVGHHILLRVHVLLRDLNVLYEDAGANYYDAKHLEHQKTYYLRKLRELGVNITVAA